jgi:hypothetical protein
VIGPPFRGGFWPRGPWRRLRLGLPTVLGLKPRGFFIPYRYADTVTNDGSYALLEALFKTREPAFRDHIALIEALSSSLEAIGDAPPPAPRWNQQWFPPLDAAAAYALVRRAPPARLVEVGSGHSTRFYARAVADGGLSTTITAIDPAPRAGIEGLNVETITETVQGAGLAPFAELAAGDILSIDSSHILMPGTDVDFLFNRVLPALPRGARVHFHDIFLPDDYPPSWEWRGYNEQLAVAALPQAGAWRVLWSSRYAATRMAGLLAEGPVPRLGWTQDGLDSSLWIEKA